MVKDHLFKVLSCKLINLKKKKHLDVFAHKYYNFIFLYVIKTKLD